MRLVIWLWILTILLPIHGLLFLGILRERQRYRKLLLQYWRLAASRKGPVIRK